jgi:hypothetical protein
MSQSQFFATKEDLVNLLRAIEIKGSLKYVSAGRSLTPDFECFSRGEDIPKLGIATFASSSNCDGFLVSEPGVETKVGLVNQSNGIKNYYINQLINPDTVVFWPGGMWTQDILLMGSVGTASDSEASRRLMRRFHTTIKKYFARTRNGYYVGPAARKLLESGKRLTIAEQSPPEFDLKLP